MALTKVTYSMISAAPYNVLDYAGLAEIVNAKNPSDPNSYLLASFLCWDKPIKAALDAANAAGGGTVVIPKNSVPYYVTDEVVVKDNITVIFEDWLILADYNVFGHCVKCVGENITLQNVLIDNSDIFAGGSGYNGLAISPNPSGTTRNVKIYGGVIKNCDRGGVAPRDGGKGIQIEPAEGENIVVDGVTFSNCFMAMSTIRDFGTVDDYFGIIYNNITADNCDILFFVKQANGTQSQTGLKHTVQLNNFYAYNCGSFEGVIQLSRASNVMISNGIVVVDPATSPTALIRGNCANCVFDNIAWYGDTDTCVNLDPSTYAVDSSQANRNNRYNIEVWGQVNTFANANISTTFRTLDNCTGNVTFRLPPAVAFFGFELRNGTSMFSMNCNTGPSGNSKIVQVQTSINFFGSGQPSTFEGFEVGTYNQVPYAASAPSTGTHFQGKVIFNSAAAAGGFVGFVCTTAGTFGSYAEGRTVTATGTATVTLSGANTELKVGMYLLINGVGAGKILSITGTTMVVSNNVTAGSGLSIAYSTPVYKTFGVISV